MPVSYQTVMTRFCFSPKGEQVLKQPTKAMSDLLCIKQGVKCECLNYLREHESRGNLFLKSLLIQRWIEMEFVAGTCLFPGKLPSGHHSEPQWATLVPVHSVVWSSPNFKLCNLSPANQRLCVSDPQDGLRELLLNPQKWLKARFLSLPEGSWSSEDTLLDR